MTDEQVKPSQTQTQLLKSSYLYPRFPSEGLRGAGRCFGKRKLWFPLFFSRALGLCVPE